MNEIVKHRNELNDFELGKLSPNQANLFTYLVYKIKDKDKVVISYDEAREKLDLPKEHRYFKKLLLQSYNKLVKMVILLVLYLIYLMNLSGMMIQKKYHLK